MTTHSSVPRTRPTCSHARKTVQLLPTRRDSIYKKSGSSTAESLLIASNMVMTRAVALVLMTLFCAMVPYNKLLYNLQISYYITYNNFSEWNVLN